jgi:hypothetical protein
MVCGSSLFLAWSLQEALGGLTLHQPKALSYVVSVPAHARRNPAAQSNDVWIRYVIVDGRSVRLNTLERTGVWDDNQTSVVHRDNGEPATLTVRGRRVTVGFISSPWSGIVRLEGERGGSDVDLYYPARAHTTFKLEDVADGRPIRESGESNYVAIAAIAMLLLAVAWVWKPWRRAVAFEAWTVMHVCVIHAVVWSTQCVGVNGDSQGYMNVLTEVIAGQAGYFPPGYPLFLGIWSATVPQATGLAVTAAQHVLMVAALYALYRMVRTFLPPTSASVGFLLTGSAAPVVFLPQAIFSENLAFLGMAGTIFFVHIRGRKSALIRDLAAGLLATVATLARVVPLLAILLPTLMLRKSEQDSSPAPLRRTARVFGTTALVLLATASWFWHENGVFGLANSQGLHLYNRVVTEQLLLNPEGSATKRFLALVGNRPLRGVAHWDISPVLSAQGLSYIDRNALMESVALEGIRKHPIRFAGHSLRMAWEEYTAAGVASIPFFAEQIAPVPALENAPLLGFRSSAMQWRLTMTRLFGIAWVVLMWTPLVGLLLVPFMKERAVFLTFLAVPAGYLLGTSFIEYFLERYVVCVIAFPLMVVPAPFAAISAVRQRYVS